MIVDCLSVHLYLMLSRVYIGVVLSFWAKTPGMGNWSRHTLLCASQADSVVSSQGSGLRSLLILPPTFLQQRHSCLSLPRIDFFYKISSFSPTTTHFHQCPKFQCAIYLSAQTEGCYSIWIIGVMIWALLRLLSWWLLFLCSWCVPSRELSTARTLSNAVCDASCKVEARKALKMFQTSPGFVVIMGFTVLQVNTPLDEF